MTLPKGTEAHANLVKELQIENKVVDYAKRRRWIVLKLNNQWSKGWPDRLFISPTGVHVYIEFKRPGNVPTELQKKRMRDLKANMCNVYWADNVELGERIINDHS